MSKKAVDRYYQEISFQYHEMLNDIKDIEKDVMNGMADPELLDRLQENILPIKQNWQRWTYMMFLLNQPERKSKVPRYQQANKKLIQHLDPKNSINSTIEENETALKELKK